MDDIHTWNDRVNALTYLIGVAAFVAWLWFGNFQELTPQRHRRARRLVLAIAITGILVGIYFNFIGFALTRP